MPTQDYAQLTDDQRGLYQQAQVLLQGGEESDGQSPFNIWQYLSGLTITNFNGHVMAYMPAMVWAISSGKTPGFIYDTFVDYLKSYDGSTLAARAYLAFAVTHDGGASVWLLINGKPGS